MEIHDLAYIAAFLDTDGWITVVPRNNRTTYGQLVGLVNRHRSVLEWVQSLFGGDLSARAMSRKSPHAKNWSQTYDLNFRAAEVVPLLTAVLPYLKIKREQAELVLELMGTMQDRTKTQEYRLPLEVRVRREEIYQKVRQLNWAGIQPRLVS